MVELVNAVRATAQKAQINVPEYMPLRDVLDTLANKKGGQMFSVTYFKVDLRPAFRKSGFAPVVINKTSFQKCAQSSKSAVVNAGGVKDNPAVKNEVEVDAENFLFMNVANGSFSLRVPTAGQDANTTPLFYGRVNLATLEVEVLTKAEYVEWLNANYAPRKEYEVVQAFRKLMLRKDVAAEFKAALADKGVKSFGLVYALH